MISMVDENRIEGGLRDAAGKVDEVIGAVAGDTGREVRGRARQVAGDAQATYGAALDEVRDFALEQPLVALGLAAGAGFIIGAFFARR